MEAIGTVNVSTLSVTNGRASEDVMDDHTPSHAVTDKERARGVHVASWEISVAIGTVGRYCTKLSRKVSSLAACLLRSDEREKLKRTLWGYAETYIDLFAEQRNV